MNEKRQDRAPRWVRGQAANESVSLYRCTQDPKLSPQELVLYRLAGTTQYQLGEPVEVTQARDFVDTWCDYAELQPQHGMPIIPPAPVAMAMQLRGWTLCE
jgi:hypothetical protein